MLKLILFSFGLMSANLPYINTVIVENQNDGKWHALALLNLYYKLNFKCTKSNVSQKIQKSLNSIIWLEK